jgi:hypothetical protein
MHFGQKSPASQMREPLGASLSSAKPKQQLADKIYIIYTN